MKTSDAVRKIEVAIRLKVPFISNHPQTLRDLALDVYSALEEASNEGLIEAVEMFTGEEITE